MWLCGRSSCSDTICQTVQGVASQDLHARLGALVEGGGDSKVGRGE